MIKNVNNGTLFRIMIFQNNDIFTEADFPHGASTLKS